MSSVIELSKWSCIKVCLHPQYQFVTRAGESHYYLHSAGKTGYKSYLQPGLATHRTIVESVTEGTTIKALRKKLMEDMDAGQAGAEMSILDYMNKSGIFVFQISDDQEQIIATVMPEYLDHQMVFATIDSNEFLIMSRFVTMRREADKVFLEAPIKGSSVVLDSVTGDRVCCALMRGIKMSDL